MNFFNYERIFKGIWCRASSCGSIDTLTPELIEQWAREKGLCNAKATGENSVGAFHPISGILLSVEGEKAFFPNTLAMEDAAWQKLDRAKKEEAQLWHKMEWFCPLWIPMKEIWKILNEVKTCTPNRAIEVFNYHTSTLYTLAFQAVCISQIMPQATSLKEIVPLAREAYLGFYSGYMASSIAALFPAIEGSLTRIASSIDANANVHTKIDHIIDRVVKKAATLHYDGAWAPDEYLEKDYLFPMDERVFFFETFRSWLKELFFCKTDKYDGVTHLNRHLFAHGSQSTWTQPSNFERLIVALATLAVVESWHDQHHNGLLFFPEMNDDSKLLWQQALLRGQIQMPLKLFEQDTYQKHGRLVPETSTDDGKLLRRAILSEDCMKDLVRPLREAGYSVQVDEPDKEGLYMKVNASSGDKRFNAVLLYSCATDNQLYKTLAEHCEVILYRGAPYHQDQFARGITVHVGPVLGWQPPKSLV